MQSPFREWTYSKWQFWVDVLRIVKLRREVIVL